MGIKTNIAWTDHTFNLVWGCVKISPGCLHCYADTQSKFRGFDIWGKDKPRRTLSAKYWAEPLKWNRAAMDAGERRRVFCSSMCDVMEDHPTVDQERQKLWPLIRATPWLDWQLLTKRPENYARFLPGDYSSKVYPNVWIGTTIENNDYVHRAEIIKKIEAPVRWISYEPALGPLDKLNLIGLDWIIYGGESGPKFRAEDKQWARDMRRRCERAKVAFFHKQSNGPRTEMGIELDGQIVREYPQTSIRVFHLPVMPAAAGDLFGR